MTVETESLAARVALGDAHVQDAELVEVAESQHGHVVTNAKLVKIYTKIRDARKALSAEFDKADTDLKLQLERVATEMKSRCLSSGQTGFKTEFGTVFIAENLMIGCADWQMFGEWLKDKDPLHYMENRIKKTAVKEYMDANNGELPPGVIVTKESEARVRAPTKPKASIEPDAAE